MNSVQVISTSREQIFNEQTSRPYTDDQDFQKDEQIVSSQNSFVDILSTVVNPDNLNKWKKFKLAYKMPVGLQTKLMNLWFGDKMDLRSYFAFELNRRKLARIGDTVLPTKYKPEPSPEVQYPEQLSSMDDVFTCEEEQYGRLVEMHTKNLPAKINRLDKPSVDLFNSLCSHWRVYLQGNAVYIRELAAQNVALYWSEGKRERNDDGTYTDDELSVEQLYVKCVRQGVRKAIKEEGRGWNRLFGRGGNMYSILANDEHPPEKRDRQADIMVMDAVEVLLSRHHRELVQQRLHGYTEQEIGERMGLTRDVVHHRLHQAYRELNVLTE